ncbi:MAG: MFS transporter [Bryobacteraceae bacterium]
MRANRFNDQSVGSLKLPLAVGFGTMILAAHVSGVNTAFPLIMRELGSDAVSGQWILTVYTLALSGCLLTFGSLGDTIGLRPVYVTGLVVYGCVSAACALATGTTGLTWLRGTQGIGAAMISATSVAMLAAHTSPARLGRALGWQSAMTYAGLAFGPPLSGALAQFLGWRALFLINAPAAVAAIAALPRLPRELNVNRCGTSFFSVSNLGWIGTLVSLTVSFRRGNYQFLALVFAGVSSCVFIWTNNRSDRPLIPLQAFRVRGFLAATAAEISFYSCLYAIGFLIPLYLLCARRLAAVDAGIFLAAQGVARAVAAPFSGRLLDHYSTGRVTVAGALTSIAAISIMCTFTDATPRMGIVAVLVLLGLGTGLFVPANSKALLGAVPAELYGASVGILATARNLGMTFGVTAAALLYTEFAPGSSPADTVAGVRMAFAIIVASALTLSVLVLTARRLSRLPTSFLIRRITWPLQF